MFQLRKKSFKKELDDLLQMFVLIFSFRLGSMKRLSGWRSRLTFRSVIQLSGGASGIKEWVGSGEVEAAPVDSIWGNSQEEEESWGENLKVSRLRKGFNRKRGLNLILERWRIHGGDKDGRNGVKNDKQWNKALVKIEWNVIQDLSTVISHGESGLKMFYL